MDQSQTDTNTTAQKSSEKGHLEISRILLEHGANVNDVANVNAVVNDMAMALLYIYILLSLAMIISIGQVLVEHSTYMRAKDIRKNNAIMTSEHFGYHTLTVFFWKHGSTVEQLIEEMKQLVHVRVEQIDSNQKCFENEILLIYRNRTPVVAKIVSQFTNGAENSEKTAKTSKCSIVSTRRHHTKTSNSAHDDAGSK